MDNVSTAAVACGYQPERYAVRLTPGQRYVLVVVDTERERQRREVWEANERVEEKVR